MKKIRLLTLFVAILLVVTTLAGCGTVGTLDRIEDRVEKRLEEAESAFENTLRSSTPATAQTLTREEAEAIALKNAGLTGVTVTGLRSEYDIDDGIPEWEIEFYSGSWEYEYTIHAETGAILHSEKEIRD